MLKNPKCFDNIISGHTQWKTLRRYVKLEDDMIQLSKAEPDIYLENLHNPGKSRQTREMLRGRKKFKEKRRFRINRKRLILLD
jgi:hypothetical protein